MDSRGSIPPQLLCKKKTIMDYVKAKQALATLQAEKQAQRDRLYNSAQLKLELERDYHGSRFQSKNNVLQKQARCT